MSIFDFPYFGINIHFRAGALGEQIGNIIIKDKDIIANCRFRVTLADIGIMYIHVNEEHERTGFGTFMVGIVKAFASMTGRPIMVVATQDTDGFWMGQGFVKKTDAKYNTYIWKPT